MCNFCVKLEIKETFFKKGHSVGIYLKIFSVSYTRKLTVITGIHMRFPPFRRRYFRQVTEKICTRKNGESVSEKLRALKNLDINFVGASYFIYNCYQDDIVTSEIRVMTPSLTLRNIPTNNLTLKKIIMFLEVHYDKRNTTDLRSKLTSLTQLPKVTPHSFVIRCIQLHQKIFLALLKSDLTFNKALVLKLFFKKLEKGINSTFMFF